MNKKTVTLWSVLLYGVTALIWITCSVLDFVYDTPSVLLRILHLLCALIWSVALFVQIHRYRSAQHKDN